MIRSISAVLLAGAISASAIAGEVVSQEGIINFSKGTYQLVSADKHTVLTGLSNQDLRGYEGLSVVLTGELTESGALEIYKVQQRKDGALVTSYDWELVNNDLYEN